MIRETVTLDEVIHLLNECVAIDPVAMASLVAARVPCSAGFCDHPTVQVGPIDEQNPAAGWEVGILGVLNGMFGVDDDGWGEITLYTKEGGSPALRFGRTSDWRRAKGGGDQASVQAAPEGEAPC